MRKGYRPGDHKVTCDRCGFEFHKTEIRLEWTGLAVCEECWEPRHPQEFVRAKPDQIAAVGVVRPEPPDTYVTIQCTERCAIPGYAIPGCAIPGETSCRSGSIPEGTF